VTVLLVAVLVINMLAYNAVPLETETENLKSASKVSLVFAISAYIVFAATQFPDTFIKRPHSVFWRVVMGLMSLYLLFLTYLLFLPLNDGR